MGKRTIRLLACGAARMVWDILYKPYSQDAVEVAEAMADGIIPASAMIDRKQGLAEVAWRHQPRNSITSYACDLAMTCISGIDKIVGVFGLPWWYRVCPIRREENANLIRCIFGNPFREMKPLRAFGGLMHVEWLTKTAAQMAEAIYNDHEWGGLPLLADELEDHGCSVGQVHKHEDGTVTYWYNDAFPDRHHLTPDRAAQHPLLEHLRHPGPHARGCWAVDLVLGKE